MPMWSIGDDRRHHMLATLASTGRPCARLKIERLPQDGAITRRSPSIMRIAGSTVLVTCANRGIGKALVEEALRQGAKQVYAGARQSIARPNRRGTVLS